jgi:small subunit ribosomal protein S2
LLKPFCNPEEIDYVIPGNDDAIRAVKLISSVIADAVIEGKKSTVEKEIEMVKP